MFSGSMENALSFPQNRLLGTCPAKSGMFSCRCFRCVEIPRSHYVHLGMGYTLTFHTFSDLWEGVWPGLTAKGSKACSLSCLDLRMRHCQMGLWLRWAGPRICVPQSPPDEAAVAPGEV